MATIKNDIVFVPTTTMPLDEYDRLKAIERQYNEFLENPDKIIIQSGRASIFGWSTTFGHSTEAVKIVNPDEAIKSLRSQLESDIEVLQRRLNKAEERPEKPTEDMTKSWFKRFLDSVIMTYRK